ncbi:MAG: sugar ABC transporter substrate-binding protein [Planctomycetaceae bacterium]
MNVSEQSPRTCRWFVVCASLLWASAGCSSGSQNESDKASASASASSSDAAASADPAAKKPKVALIMKSLANEFFSTMADGAVKHQAANAQDYDLVVNGIKDERDLSRQVAIVEEMIAARADAIVIAPADSKALVPVLRRAQEAGLIVINIDNRLDADILKQEGVTIPFVGPDNRQGAKQVGDYLAAKLTKGDKVAILEGIKTSINSQQRKAGFEDAASEAGLSIVSSQSAQWEMSVANTIASSMLSEHPDLKAILACNDSMALGALAAVKAASRGGEVLIVGFDNITAVQQAIRDGSILATADQHGDQLAVFGIKYALSLHRDPSVSLSDRETPVDLVTAQTLAQ